MREQDQYDETFRASGRWLKDFLMRKNCTLIKTRLLDLSETMDKFLKANFTRILTRESIKRPK